MKNQKRFSVIVPTYNSEKTIRKCMSSIFGSTFRDFEVIVVDDCSTDSTKNIVSKFRCRFFSLKNNSGPAFARNFGAKKARGKILFFVDSDIILKNDALEMTDEFYRKNKEAVCVIGMYAKEPANKRWIHYYQAFWKYYTWTPSPKYFSFFIASCGTIKRKTFLELNGFNTKYKGADVEDYEFGYRVNKAHKIFLNPGMQGYHHFPYLKSVVKNYFKRSVQWFQLFIKRKKFDTGVASASNGLSFILSSVSSLLLILLAATLNPAFFYLFIAFFIVFLSFHRRFYSMALSEKGFPFMVYCILVSYMVSLVVTAGISISFIKYISLKIMKA